MLLNTIQKDPLYKIVVFGPPGTGKTHLGTTAPKPLVLLFERHGFETIRTACKISGREMPPVIWVTSANQFARIQVILATSEEPIKDILLDREVITDNQLPEGVTRAQMVESLPYTRPESVVVDSITEAAELIAGIVDANGGTETIRGITFRKLSAYGPIEKKVHKAIRLFRDLPYHVLFLALLVERNVGSEKDPDVRLRPALPGRKLWSHLEAAVNAVGIIRLHHSGGSDGAVTRRWVQFISSEKIATKVAYPLQAREPADASVWFQALASGEPSAGLATNLGGDGESSSVDTKKEKTTGKKGKK